MVAALLGLQTGVKLQAAHLTHDVVILSLYCGDLSQTLKDLKELIKWHECGGALGLKRRKEWEYRGDQRGKDSFCAPQKNDVASIWKHGTSSHPKRCQDLPENVDSGGLVGHFPEVPCQTTSALFWNFVIKVILVWQTSPSSLLHLSSVRSWGTDRAGVHPP